MARTTVQNTMGRIRRQLHSSGRNEVNQLDTTMSSSTTSCILEWATSAVIPGTILNIDLELMRVVEYDSGTKTATVVRGYMDSDNVAHVAGDEVLIDPRFSNLDIYDALVDEINSWGPQLYRVLSDEFSVDAGTQTIDLPLAWRSMYGIIDIVRKWDDLYQTTTAWPRVEARLTRGTTDWSEGAPTSGLLVRLVEPTATGTVYMTVAMPFSTSAPALTDDLVTALYVPESMFDVLSMGVKLRLVQDSEWGRSARQAQDDSRRSEENPPGGQVQPLQFGSQLYRFRKQEEINKLRAQYPIRIS